MTTSTPETLFFEGVVRVRPSPQTRRIMHMPRPAAACDEAVREFYEYLFRAAGVQPGGYRMNALSRRIPACLRQLGVKDLAEARERLVKQPELINRLISVALLGVTDFFRDEPVFEKLRQILPRIAPAAGPGARLRIWSAACSDGHELYSVALLLSELGLLDQAELLGTDCRREAIERARRGVYPTEMVRGVQDPAFQDYFNEVRGGMCIWSTLREAARWNQADLFQTSEPGPWDMILWRNMAIYLEQTASRGIWERLYSELAPGGYLVTGKADHPPQHLYLQRLGNCIFRKPPVHR